MSLTEALQNEFGGPVSSFSLLTHGGWKGGWIRCLEGVYCSCFAPCMVFVFIRAELVFYILDLVEFRNK